MTISHLKIKRLPRFLFVFIALLALIIQATESEAAQQYQGLCSYVKMEILQELTLERVGFLATLEVTNNEGDASITDFSAVLTFEGDPAGDGTIVDTSNLFFVQPPEILGVTDIGGTGIIAPGQTATVSWFIIPKLTAGGTLPQGVQYQIGAQLAGSIYGLEISEDVLLVLPDTITVKPDPELEITYFQPRDVDGDNPFTMDIVESPIPFTLGVLVNNVGYGRANSVQIASEQPQIVENTQGLLVVPQLIGSRVNDQPINSTSLTVNLGNIEPGKCRKGAWDMITTLSGEFTDFKASYTHDSELGGRDTSIIKNVNAYFMVHEVLNDQPGRDSLLDFLAEVTGIGDLIPDTLYESECNTLPVSRLLDVSLLNYSGTNATVRANADFENWVFIRIDDPAQAKYPISQVVRSDGKVLNPNNYWTNIRYRKPDNTKLTYLNIFDFVSLGEYQYTVTYAPPTIDTDPPVTRLLFTGEYEELNGKHYVLPETQLYFLAEDINPVEMFYRLDSAPVFAPAFPFTIATAGEHTVEFYSIDSQGNEEIHTIATVVVSTTPPEFTNTTIDTEEVFISGDAISVRPTEVRVGFTGATTSATLSASAEVYRGVYAWPSVSGVPSSLTSSTTASLLVSGENLDYYQYRVGANPWSQEYLVSEPINLTGLSGTVLVSVRGRNRNGNYSDNAIVTVSWLVDLTAPPTVVTGMPASPTRNTDAILNVSGVDLYRFTIDTGYYRAEIGFDQPITLTRLSEGRHAVEVIGKQRVNPWQDQLNATYVTWVVDRQYGLMFPEGEKVYYADLGNVNNGSSEFVWNGRTNAGVAVSPGWYTVKVTLLDGLGRFTSAVKQVYIGDLLPDGAVISDAGNANQMEAHASGKWSVWQDQRSGNWDIFAQDITDPAAVAFAVTANQFNQERPRTDGKFVVWEDRQADGTWDVWAWEFGSIGPVFSITASPETNEKKPYVAWPWVVYQSQPVANPSAPWQVQAYNMITGVTENIDITSQNQMDPMVHKQRVVWQDFRDVGFGEIYFKDLKTGNIKRITNNPGGQYHPVIFNQWIVWSDNRNVQFDLYGYNLRRGAEVRITNTVEDETRPNINGEWVVYSEDSTGEQQHNLRIAHLSNFASIQLTNKASLKDKPSHASGRLIWSDNNSGHWQVMNGAIPDLQPVFNNRNSVAVTGGMVFYQQDAFTLLKLWNQQAGVNSITHYSSLLPIPVLQTASWINGAPVGDNFLLAEGNFLWVKFDNSQILDLGTAGCSQINLLSGINGLSYSCFPDEYSAYKLIRELGLANIKGVQALNSKTGQWQTASVVAGKIVGSDFPISEVGVLMIDMNVPHALWSPGR